MTTWLSIEIANETVKLLGSYIEHNRHGTSERFIRVFCEYQENLAQGLLSKLRSLFLATIRSDQIVSPQIQLKAHSITTNQGLCC